ncbi:MAG: pilus assembly protein PilP [Syntrophaceae bacterium]|nr:pilus assembly protein PilP [Syntrophaceae bacterium]
MTKVKRIILIFFATLVMPAFFIFAQDAEKTAENNSPDTTPASIESKVEETQAQIQQKLASIAQTADGIYSYNPAGKPDPFRPFIEIDKKKEAPKKEAKKELDFSIFPLQRVGTENFRVVGIAGDEARRVAVVEDSAKKFYPLFKGTRIGTKNGKVIEIMADRVIVEEREENKAKRVILKLRKD